MASDFGLFIGWGAPKPGREQQAIELFQESQKFNEKLKQRGDVESYESVSLDPHGGDLGGFTLMRGAASKLNKVRSEDPEFLSLITRANLCLTNVGIVGAAIGDGLVKRFDVFQQAIRAIERTTVGVR